MTFMNKKEDVIDVQLTQHGKRLLAEGKFKPIYYAFFDQDIIYDGDKANVSEQQNAIESRIQEETSRLKAQHVFYNVDTELKARFYKTIGNDEDRIIQPHFFEKNYTDINEIGTCDLNTEYKPSWNVKFMHGEVSSSTSYVTGAHQTLLIPQLSSSIVYSTQISKRDQKPAGEDPQLAFNVYPDGTYVSVMPEYLLLDVTEENTEYQFENFDIEVFLVEDENLTGSLNTPGTSQTTVREKLTPLLFTPKQSSVINEILTDQPTKTVELTPEYVEYYFNCFVDYEIDKDLLCQGVQELRAKGIIIDSELVDCPEKKEILRMNPYYSAVSDDDLENCSTE